MQKDTEYHTCGLHTFDMPFRLQLLAYFLQIMTGCTC